MKPLFGYLFLAVGIFAGIAANSFAKISEGFTKTLPIIYMYLLMMVCLFCIAKAMHTLSPAGVGRRRIRSRPRVSTRGSVCLHFEGNIDEN